jgi:hypothetical protein
MALEAVPALLPAERDRVVEATWQDLSENARDTEGALSTRTP